MHPEHGPLHVEYSITRNVMESATEAGLGIFFENLPKGDIHVEFPRKNVALTTTNNSVN